MISDHVQLLLTTFARGAWDIDPVANAAAQRAHRLLGQMLETVKARLMAKDAAKDPPHAEASRRRRRRQARTPTARRWSPPTREFTRVHGDGRDAYAWPASSWRTCARAAVMRVPPEGACRPSRHRR